MKVKAALFLFSRVRSGGVCDRQLPQGQTHGGSQRAGQATDGEGAERRPVAHLRKQTGTGMVNDDIYTALCETETHHFRVGFCKLEMSSSCSSVCMFAGCSRRRVCGGDDRASEPT